MQNDNNDFIEIYRNEVSDSVFEEFKACKNAVYYENLTDEWIRFYTIPQERMIIEIPVSENDVDILFKGIVYENGTFNWSLSPIDNDNLDVKLVFLSQDEYEQREV